MKLQKLGLLIAISAFSTVSSATGLGRILAVGELERPIGSNPYYPITYQVPKTYLGNSTAGQLPISSMKTRKKNFLWRTERTAVLF